MTVEPQEAPPVGKTPALTLRCPYCGSKVFIGLWHSCRRYLGTLMFRE